MKNNILFILKTSKVLVLLFILLHFCSCESQKLAYTINVLQPKEGQRFKAGEYVNVEVITEGKPAVNSLTVMLGRRLEMARSSSLKTRIKIDDGENGEKKIIIAASSPRGFAGRREVSIFIIPQDSAGEVKKEELFTANELEWVYFGIAYDSKSSEMCSKISQQGIKPQGKPFPDSPASYLRSECFFTLATLLEDKNLCAEVKSMPAVSSGSSIISREECIKAVGEKRNLNTRMWFDYESLLATMHYKAEDIPESYGYGGKIDYERFYRDIIDTDDFKRRLKDLPDFSKGEGLDGF